MVEAARAQDRKQAKAYGSFLEKLRPLYLSEKINIQKAEIEKYIFIYHFEQIPYHALNVFNEHLSQVWADFGQGLEIIGENLAGFISELHGNAHSLDIIKNCQNIYPGILKILQKARSEDQSNASIQNQIFHNWFSALLPVEKPDRSPIVKSEAEDIVSELTANRENLFMNCPAICSEHHISDFRSSNSARHPNPQDAIDLMHAVPALAYCDALITNDGFLRSGAEHVAKKQRRNLIISHSLSEGFGQLTANAS